MIASIFIFLSKGAEESSENGRSQQGMHTAGSTGEVNPREDETRAKVNAREKKEEEDKVEGKEEVSSDEDETREPRVEIEDRPSTDCGCYPTRRSTPPSMMYDEVQCKHINGADPTVNSFQLNWTRPGKIHKLDNLKYMKKKTAFTPKDYSYMLGYPHTTNGGKYFHDELMEREGVVEDDLGGGEMEESTVEEEASRRIDEEPDDIFISAPKKAAFYNNDMYTMRVAKLYQPPEGGQSKPVKVRVELEEDIRMDSLLTPVKQHTARVRTVEESATLKDDNMTYFQQGLRAKVYEGRFYDPGLSFYTHATT